MLTVMLVGYNLAETREKLNEDKLNIPKCDDY